MSTNTHLTTALNDWAEVFMARSMHDMVQFIKDAGISMPQLSTLMHLHHRGACGVTDIGEHLGVTSPAASQMIDRMVQQGLLERAEDTADRRVRQISVTEKGRQLIEKSILARQRWMGDLTAVLTAREQEQAIQALNLLTRTARHLKPQAVAGNLPSTALPLGEAADPQ
jgi:DNA-binding MarR family transcriptional regulator